MTTTYPYNYPLFDFDYPYAVQLSKIKSTPKGLGRIAGLVVCRVSHAPSLTVSKTGKTAKVYGSETLEDGGVWLYPTNLVQKG